MRTLTEAAVWEALAEVPDPEIPVLSVVDLGLVHRVELDGDRLRVELLPTFVGCPALELIRESVANRLAGMAPVVEVEMTFAVPWTSDRITPRAARSWATADSPPDRRICRSESRSSAAGRPRLQRPKATACPWCGSADTTLENLFGPTLCRTVFFCNHCRQPFEQFKAV